MSLTPRELEAIEEGIALREYDNRAALSELAMKMAKATWGSDDNKPLWDPEAELKKVEDRFSGKNLVAHTVDYKQQKAKQAEDFKTVMARTQAHFLNKFKGE